MIGLLSQINPRACILYTHCFCQNLQINYQLHVIHIDEASAYNDIKQSPTSYSSDIMAALCSMVQSNESCYGVALEDIFCSEDEMLAEVRLPATGN